MPSSDSRAYFLGKVLAVIMVVLVALASAEILLRAWFNLLPPLNHNLLPPGKAGLHLFQPAHGNAFYSVKRHYQQTFLRHEFRVDVRTNNMGLRENLDYVGEHVDIAFVGDSFTFGWGVEVGQRYSDVVAQSFPRLNVLSYAYPNGHGPANYLAFLQNRPKLIPDILVLGLFAFNDLADDTADAVIETQNGKIRSVGSKSLKVNSEGFVVNKNYKTPSFPSADWWAHHMAIGRTFNVALKRLRSGGKSPPRADEWSSLDRGEWDGTALEALGYIRDLHRLTDAAGSTLVVFYIPFPSYVSETPVCTYTSEMCTMQRVRNDLGNALAQWTGAEGIHYIDPVDYFRKLAKPGEPLYYSYDAHWSPAGHAAAGELISDFIQEVLIRHDSREDAVYLKANGSKGIDPSVVE
jgi:hypothetical protein